MSSDAGSRNTYHFPIVQLVMPQTLALGRVSFRPVGWLAELLSSDVAKRTENPELWTRLQREASELKWSTADVEAEDDEAARAAVWDAVSALRLYQRSRYLFVNLDSQTFGLAADIYSATEDHWRTQGATLVGAGWERHGIMGSWEFRAADIDAAAADPLFQQLNRLVAVTPDEATDLDRRLLIALRMLGRSTRLLPSSLRVVQLAAALEALLGDESPTSRTHKVALRAAFLTCELDGKPHGPDRPCFYLGCWTLKELKRGITATAATGRGAFCSAYWDIRELQELRNTVLHEALIEVERPQSAEGQVDDVLRHLLRWRREAPGRDSIADLDRDVRAAAIDWPSGTPA